MCMHCENRVKTALEALDGVFAAHPDHAKNEVTIEISGDVSEAAIKGAVEGAGYKFTGIKK